MTVLHETLQSLRLGEPVRFLNLSLFPLQGNTKRPRNYLTLNEAIAAGSLRIGEVSAGGRVPELLVTNTGKQPVLILDGEELIGAKQNRTTNVTILVAADSELRIPVTCVEAGRWGYSRPDFAASEQLHFAEGRRSKLRQVHFARLEVGEAVADQGAVWSEIGAKTRRMAVDSPTSAMTDIYRSHRARVEDYVGAFHPLPDQVGAVFAIGDRIEGLELFDSVDTLATVLPKLIRSYAIDAIERVSEHRRNPELADAAAFLKTLGTASEQRFPAVGLGEEVRLTAPGILAAALEVDGEILHLVAFAEPARSGERNDPFQSLRRRRRYRS